MAVAAQGNVTIDTIREYWACHVSHTFGGVDTGLTVPGLLLLNAGLPKHELVIDGVTVYYAKAGGGVFVSPYIYPSIASSHALTPWTTGGNTDARNYATTGMFARLGGNDVFRVLATTAAMDMCVISAWGKLLDPGEPVPQPVDLRKLSLWGR